MISPNGNDPFSQARLNCYVVVKNSRELYCPFCESRKDTDLINHLFQFHANENEVVELKGMSLWSPEYDRSCTKLENHGLYKYNLKTLEQQNGKIIVAKLPANQDPSQGLDIESFEPCDLCYGFYHSSEIALHMEQQCMFSNITQPGYREGDKTSSAANQNIYVSSEINNVFGGKSLEKSIGNETKNVPGLRINKNIFEYQSGPITNNAKRKNELYSNDIVKLSDSDAPPEQKESRGGTFQANNHTDPSMFNNMINSKHPVIIPSQEHDFVHINERVVSDCDLKRGIANILKNVKNLHDTTAKAVRLQLEKDFGINLNAKRNEVVQLIREVMKDMETEKHIVAKDKINNNHLPPSSGNIEKRSYLAKDPSPNTNIPQNIIVARTEVSYDNNNSKKESTENGLTKSQNVPSVGQSSKDPAQPKEKWLSSSTGQTKISSYFSPSTHRIQEERNSPYQGESRINRTISVPDCYRNNNKPELMKSNDVTQPIPGQENIAQKRSSVFLPPIISPPRFKPAKGHKNNNEASSKGSVSSFGGDRLEQRKRHHSKSDDSLISKKTKAEKGEVTEKQINGNDLVRDAKVKKKRKKGVKSNENKKMAPPSSTSDLRLSVRKGLIDALNGRINDNIGMMITFTSGKNSVEQIVVDIEHALHQTLKEPAKYKAKYRSLLFNIKDKSNDGLYRKIICREFTPDYIAKMTAEEMASKELKEKRESQLKKDIDLIKSEEVEIAKMRDKFYMKTHKGDVVVGDDSKSDSTTEKQTMEELKLPDEVELEEIKPTVGKDPKTWDPKTWDHGSHAFELSCDVCTGRINFEEVLKIKIEKEHKEKKAQDTAAAEEKARIEENKSESKSIDKSITDKEKQNREQNNKTGNESKLSPDSSSYAKRDKERERDNKRPESREKHHKSDRRSHESSHRHRRSHDIQKENIVNEEKLKGENSKHSNKDRELDKKKVSESSMLEKDGRIKEERRSTESSHREHKRHDRHHEKRHHEREKDSSNRESHKSSRHHKEGSERREGRDSSTSKRPKHEKGKPPETHNDHKQSSNTSYNNKKIEEKDQDQKIKVEKDPDKKSPDLENPNRESISSKISPDSTKLNKTSITEEEKTGKIEQPKKKMSKDEYLNKKPKTILPSTNLKDPRVKAYGLPEDIKPKCGKDITKENEVSSTVQINIKPPYVKRDLGPVVWSGKVDMPDNPRFTVSAHQFSGTTDYINVDLKDSLKMVGRIQPQNVWSFVEDVKKNPLKERILLRLQPNTNDDEKHYFSVFKYLQNRNRMGVMESNSKFVKSSYLIPLGSDEDVHASLRPLDGHELEKPRPNILLLLVVRNCERSMGSFGTSKGIVTSSTNADRNDNIHRTSSSSSYPKGTENLSRDPRRKVLEKESPLDAAVASMTNKAPSFLHSSTRHGLLR